MVQVFNALGAPLLSFFQYLGELVLLTTDTFRSIFTHKLRWKLFLNQIVEVGLLSQLVVVITGGFTGAVFSAQTFFQFNKIGMGSAVGAVVSVSLCRELAPVLTALMVAGQVDAQSRHHYGPVESVLLRHSHCLHQLQQRIDRTRGRCWRRPGDDRGSG